MKIQHILILMLGGSLVLMLTRSTSVAEDFSINMSSQIDGSNLNRPNNNVQYDLSLIRRSKPPQSSTTGLFESKSWEVRPQARVVEIYAPIQQEITPPVPYKYIGKIVDDNEVTVFLSNQERQFSVKENDVLENNYRVDRISEAGIYLTYIPTNTKQVIQISNTSELTASVSIQN